MQLNCPYFCLDQSQRRKRTGTKNGHSTSAIGPVESAVKITANDNFSWSSSVV